LRVVGMNAHLAQVNLRTNLILELPSFNVLSELDNTIVQIHELRGETS